MEWKIGEIRQVDGEWYQCLTGYCKDCAFLECKDYCKDLHRNAICTANLIFKKLEKVGKPYEYFIQGMGVIMVQEYTLANSNYTCDENKHVVIMDCQNGRVAIEIKQNKEDMEENYRYIVYVENSDEGYYSTYYTQKESNKIEDIVAIVKSEDKAKDMCKDRPDLGYRKIIWED